MKKVIKKLAHLLIIAIAHFLINSSIFAQAPQKMSYQAIIRNSNDSLLVSTPVGMLISLVQSSPTGIVVYSETQTATTNANGLVSLQIGMGTAVSGTFASIDWAAGPYYVKTETDLSGGTNYTIISSNELLSVPYALFSTNGTPGPQGPQGVAGINGISSGGGTGCYNCPTMISTISESSLSLSSTISYCSNLSEGGYTNWRIPTLDEFEFIRDELNLPVSSIDSWTKDFQIVGNGQAGWTSPIYVSTNRNILMSMKAVCVR